ncbi:tetratricopeptide repeat protein [Mangrovibacterium lignilyticum]|uniref:hypothetical protein n=1 Tax=Mangrovibacterium lignilyticum TaxID=2668052 RepID=UPI0013D407E0|nr:hypothetical protein [Mangrovibacterium lignilyticum]
MKTKFLIIVALLSFFIGCQSTKKEKQPLSYITATCAPPPTSDSDWYKTDKKAPVFEGLNVYHYPVTTNSDEAQRYFDQGLILAYGFNHAEAARSFYYATKLDPEFAMAYCGYAYVLGPNYNAGMESDNYQRAYDAIQKAIALSDHVTPKEKALIQTVAKRYSKEVPEDRTNLDVAYSESLKELVQQYPDDPDIGTLYAESMMNLHPWDLYEADGTAKPWTPEIITTLENVMRISPKHPGANHFYIHAVEASSTPERGLASAKRYDDGLVPGAGHLVHMPSHIYIRTGYYHLGTVANIRAVKVDSLYTTACHAQGVYPLAYYPHNYHFLSATATLEGNSYWGIKAAEKMAQQINIQLMQEPGWGTLQHYYSIPYYVYVKFGKWDKILERPAEVATLTYPAAIRSYARGMAFLGKKDVEAAKEEFSDLEKYAQDESLKQLTIWEINSTYELVQIARDVLKAEILASENNFDDAIAILKETIKLEDSLNYNEPPDWFFSVRHNLGAIQIEAGHYQDAVQTFTEDLQELPNNGWALHGLKTAYAKLNQKDHESEVDKLLADVWKTADTQITTARIK